MVGSGRSDGAPPAEPLAARPRCAPSPDLPRRAPRRIVSPRTVRVTILASGSSGNSILVEAGGVRLLVDAGLRGRALASRLAAAGAQAPTAALLTHEHSDHVCGAAELLAQGVPTYATAGTAAALPAAVGEGRAAIQPVRPGEALRLGALELRAVALPHDAAEPVAYVLSDGQVRLGVLTDCGHAAPEVAQAFAGCDALVLETNYDRRMLLSGPYPMRLKRRIASDEGHLSNEQAAELLGQILAAGPRPRLVICAHLSKTNNQAALARAALARALGRGPGRPATQLHVAEQDRPLGPFEVGRAAIHLGPQLCLPFAV